MALFPTAWCDQARFRKARIESGSHCCRAIDYSSSLDSCYELRRWVMMSSGDAPALVGNGNNGDGIVPSPSEAVCGPRRKRSRYAERAASPNSSLARSWTSQNAIHHCRPPRPGDIMIT
jgi:hypothetical protein